MKSIHFLVLFFFPFLLSAQQTPFEKSNGTETATYFQAIDFYKSLARGSSNILVKTMGPTDAGYPLHLVMISNDGKFDPNTWHKQKKVVILVNYGIHPGEPDGIDASMMLARDILNTKVHLPDNVAIAFIPVYNIGGCLNRNSYSRANQNGPISYGFRGNSQNLDLNRDFTKCDSKEARSYTGIFHYLDPEIQVDNHVSDGADYQATMTLITTQYDKLGGNLGNFLKEKFEPTLYEDMKSKGWDMIPYVNFETGSPDQGMEQFYDPPRYSSGYAALFQTLSFIPETHMLKPFIDRVMSTYALMETLIKKASANSEEIIVIRKRSRDEVVKQKFFPLGWKTDSSKYSMITFRGYEQGFKTSEATGLQRMFYDRTKPFTKQVKYFNLDTALNIIPAPEWYVIPQGWKNVIDILSLNGVVMKRMQNDSSIELYAYHIDEYKSSSRPYEKHHRNTDVKTSLSKQVIRLQKGDYIIPLNQETNRYIVEMLEPTGDDSFFSWNFFDAILQQKEGYSDYRWEDLAAGVLKSDPSLKFRLDARKSSDPKFAANASEQLNFIYKNSPYYEPAHLRYPVYRIGNPPLSLQLDTKMGL